MTTTEFGVRVAVGDLILEVRQWPGVGTPILMLHEGLGSVAMWRDFPQELAHRTGHPVVAWSRQGYGRSAPHPGPRDPAYMHLEAERVPVLMDALALHSAHFFGHSDGGSIALIAAARYPESVASLILEAPHVFVEELTHDSIAKVRGSYLASDLSQKLARYHADPDHAFWHWNDIWLDPRFRGWNIEDVLPGIRVPSLLIQGIDDQYGTLDQLDRISAAIPDSERLELTNCGHSPHRDQPEAVLAAASAFLRKMDHAL